LTINWSQYDSDIRLWQLNNSGACLPAIDLWGDNIYNNQLIEMGELKLGELGLLDKLIDK
jgi:hypothetical protein